MEEAINEGNVQEAASGLKHQEFSGGWPLSFPSTPSCVDPRIA
jgi:hypothetical protein